MFRVGLRVRRFGLRLSLTMHFWPRGKRRLSEWRCWLFGTDWASCSRNAGADGDEHGADMRRVLKPLEPQAAGRTPNPT